MLISAHSQILDQKIKVIAQKFNQILAIQRKGQVFKMKMRLKENLHMQLRWKKETLTDMEMSGDFLVVVLGLNSITSLKTSGLSKFTPRCLNLKRKKAFLRNQIIMCITHITVLIFKELKRTLIQKIMENQTLLTTALLSKFPCEYN